MILGKKVDSGGEDDSGEESSFWGRKISGLVGPVGAPDL